MLCVIGVIYGALVAWVQQDIKKLVAYSSVSHLGFCVLGLLALNEIGIQGSILYMINHGISTGAMFLVIGMVYDRFHTRDINELSGLARRMPVMSFFFVFFVLSSIGLPGLNGFVSEFLTILGAFTSTHLGIAFGSFRDLRGRRDGTNIAFYDVEQGRNMVASLPLPRSARELLRRRGSLTLTLHSEANASSGARNLRASRRVRLGARD